MKSCLKRKVTVQTPKVPHLYLFIVILYRNGYTYTYRYVSDLLSSFYVLKSEISQNYSEKNRYMLQVLTLKRQALEFREAQNICLSFTQTWEVY